VRIGARVWVAPVGAKENAFSTKNRAPDLSAELRTAELLIAIRHLIDSTRQRIAQAVNAELIGPL
jgi:hypothetical protein